MTVKIVSTFSCLSQTGNILKEKGCDAEKLPVSSRNGCKDGQLKPKEQIARAEMAQIMSNMFQSVYESGELMGSYPNTVLVRGAVNIHDAVFNGDLIIANGLRERKIELNNTTVKGRLVVWSGSEIRISGNSAVAGIVTPRNDGPMTVIFDETASELSEQSCSISRLDVEPRQ